METATPPTHSGGIDYDPFMPSITGGDPYPVYESLRAQFPRLFKEEYNAWFFSTFEDVWQLLKLSELSVSGGITPSQLLLNGQPNPDMISQMDPPTHTEVRTPLNRNFFRPAAVAEMEGEMRSIARRLAEDVARQGGCDLVADYASPFACEVACLLSGLPRSDCSQLIKWINGFFHRTPGVRGDSEVGALSGSQMNQYVTDYINDLKGDASKASGVLATLMEGEIEGRPFLLHEMVAMIMNVQIGASDTVPKGICAALFRLWESPQQRKLLLSDMSLAQDAFTEAVRIDMPTQMQGRVATEDFDFHGTQILRGQRTMLMFAAANRDPGEFPDPNRFDIQRKPARVLNFGNGIHRCLGVHLAALEGRIALEEFLRVAPDYKVRQEKSNHHETEYVKGWAQLHIAL